jgi:hypothetical protein
MIYEMERIIDRYTYDYRADTQDDNGHLIVKDAETTDSEHPPKGDGNANPNNIYPRTKGVIQQS